MSLEITNADEVGLDPATWNEYVDRSPHSTPFHRYEALEVQSSHSGTACYPLVGYKGEEPTGIFPVFEVRKGPFRAAFSPPPYLWVGYLGPAMLNVEGLKQRKRDRRHEQFIGGCLEWVRETFDPHYLKFSIVPGFDDLRPFQRNDCTLTLRYTYVVDLKLDREELLMRFSSDGRSNIRDATEAESSFVIEERGEAAIGHIIRQVRRRYESHDRAFQFSAPFAVDLYQRLPGGYVRPYVVELDGDPVGGMLVLDDGETVYRWQGGSKPDADIDIAVNDILDWRVMSDALDRGRSVYDMAGAGVRRINTYKAKFNPRLEPAYVVQDSKPGISTLVDVYGEVRNKFSTIDI